MLRFDCGQGVTTMVWPLQEWIAFSTGAGALLRRTPSETEAIMFARTLAGAAVVAAVFLTGCAPSTTGSSEPSDTSAQYAPSSRRFKEDISYLTSEQLGDLAESVMTVRLATFRYKNGDGSKHLGYILEDSPDVMASDMGHQRVDLYAYASMAVAALQVQARDIRALEADVDLLTWQVEKLSHAQNRPMSKASRIRSYDQQAQAILEEAEGGDW